MGLIFHLPLKKLNGVKFFLEKLIFDSWWVVMFILFCYLCYEQGIKKHDKEYTRMKNHFTTLHNEYQQVLKTREKLLAEKRSANDPEWIEKVLMEELGLKPSEQIKIIFTPPYTK